MLSFGSPGVMTGVDRPGHDSDLVRFVPSSLGANTAGTFTLWFDGSDVGLTQAAENIDAVDVLAADRRGTAPPTQ